MTNNESNLQMLETQLETLLGELLEIDCQLGEPVRLDVTTGKRMSEVAYHQWRSKALRAKRVKTLQYRQLRANLRAERRKCLTEGGSGGHDAHANTTKGDE